MEKKDSLNPDVGRILDLDEISRSRRLGELEVSNDDLRNEIKRGKVKTTRGRRTEGREKRATHVLGLLHSESSTGEPISSSSVDSEKSGVRSNVDDFSVSLDDSRDSDDLLRGSGDGSSEGRQGGDWRRE